MVAPYDYVSDPASAASTKKNSGGQTPAGVYRMKHARTLSFGSIEVALCYRAISIPQPCRNHSPSSVPRHPLPIVDYEFFEARDEDQV
jgi:hypothetical protein